jgi:hypothetical protein
MPSRNGFGPIINTNRSSYFTGGIEGALIGANWRDQSLTMPFAALQRYVRGLPYIAIVSQESIVLIFILIVGAIGVWVIDTIREDLRLL